MPRKSRDDFSEATRHHLARSVNYHCSKGGAPTAAREGDLERLREHSALWRRQLEKLRSRLSGLTIEPPTRVQ